jgi:hypothetical protein
MKPVIGKQKTTEPTEHVDVTGLDVAAEDQEGADL